MTKQGMALLFAAGAVTGLIVGDILLDADAAPKDWTRVVRGASARLTAEVCFYDSALPDGGTEIVGRAAGVAFDTDGLQALSGVIVIPLDAAGAASVRSAREQVLMQWRKANRLETP